MIIFFFFNGTATTEIYPYVHTLSLHDALPIAVNTALGLLEVSSVDGSVDNKTHNSGISASFDVQYGLNPASTLIPIARLGGVTHAVVMPDYDDSDKERELPFAGKAALISLGEGEAILHRPGSGMMHA